MTWKEKKEIMADFLFLWQLFREEATTPEQVAAALNLPVGQVAAPDMSLPKAPDTEELARPLTWAEEAERIPPSASPGNRPAWAEIRTPPRPSLAPFVLPPVYGEKRTDKAALMRQEKALLRFRMGGLSVH